MSDAFCLYDHRIPIHDSPKLQYLENIGIELVDVAGRDLRIIASVAKHLVNIEIKDREEQNNGDRNVNLDMVLFQGGYQIYQKSEAGVFLKANGSVWKTKGMRNPQNSEAFKNFLFYQVRSAEGIDERIESIYQGYRNRVERLVDIRFHESSPYVHDGVLERAGVKSK